MPLNPDVVAEFVVGLTCPPDDALNSLLAEVESGFLPSTGGNRRSLALCAQRTTLGTNVVSMGIWADASGFSEDERRTALASTHLLVPGRTVALLVTARAIQLMADAAWATTDKTADAIVGGVELGKVTLDETIDIDIQPNRIVTTVTGRFDPRGFPPPIGFTTKVTDILSLRQPGSEPPLETESSTDTDVGFPGLVANSLMAAILSPILGAIIFFSADPIAESQAPDTPGAGGSLAAQWPPEVLTEIIPPFLPGKFVLAWRDLTVDEDGVLTLGTFAGAQRQPQVSIVGPRSVAIREALGHAQATYGVNLDDLRNPIVIQWSAGEPSEDARTTITLFWSAGSPRLSVNVSDADGLSAANQITITVTVIPLEDGQQPF